MQQLKGIHHVTAITSSAKDIYHFFTYVLGLRLVKKTVNQDDINTYHLFFADDVGAPGTDMTFFDFKGSGKAMHGTNEISRTSFRVPSDEALTYFAKRFTFYHVKQEAIKEHFGVKYLYFEDFDGQRYALVSDEKNKGIKSGTPWQKGPVPLQYAITGLGPIFMRVNDVARMRSALINILAMEEKGKEKSFYLFAMGEGGNGASVILEENIMLPVARQGFGAVHHVAFRVTDKKEIMAWIDVFTSARFPHSGHVDRFYFESLYTRLYPNILFELATEGPGFIDDEESYETLGETLALPPFYRDKRGYVESVVDHFDTVRSNKTFVKEDEDFFNADEHH